MYDVTFWAEFNNLGKNKQINIHWKVSTCKMSYAQRKDTLVYHLMFNDSVSNWQELGLLSISTVLGFSP